MPRLTTLVMIAVLMVTAYWATLAQYDPVGLAERVTQIGVVQRVAQVFSPTALLRWLGLAPVPDAAPVQSPQGPGTASEVPGRVTYHPATSAVPEEGTTRTTLFFSDLDGMFLVPVSRTIERTPGILRATLDQLLAGPAPNSGLAPSVPPMDYAKITFSDGRAGIDLGEQVVAASAGWGSTTSTTALNAIVYTLGTHPAVTQVQFTVDGDPAEVIFHGLSGAEPFLRVDWSSTEDVLTLYLAHVTAGRAYLVPYQVTSAGGPEPARMTEALGHLARGIQVGQFGLQPTIPAEVAVGAVSRSGTVVRVDFAAGVEQAYGGDPALQAMMIDSIVFTLTSFPGVQAVEFLVEGRPAPALGQKDLSAPVTRPQWINPEDPTMGG